MMTDLPIITVGESEFEPVPSGTYLVSLESIRSGQKGAFGSVFNFEFCVHKNENGDLSKAGTMLRDFVNSQKEGEQYTKKHKLVKYASALSWRKYEKNESFDLNNLLGKKAWAHVKCTEGTNKIEGLSPYLEDGPDLGA